MDEEVVLLEEQITALQADVERLQDRLAAAETLAGSREADLTRLCQQLAETEAALSQRDAAAAAMENELTTLRAATAAAQAQGREAGGRYRDLLLAYEPDLPADLVTGETIDEIDAAAERARQMVLQVRQRFEAQAQATRVPAGAPVRGALDASALTASEKIRLGLQQGA